LKLSESSATVQRWIGHQFSSENHLYQGELARALKELADAVASYPEPNSTTARSNVSAAHVLLATGRYQEAYDQAEIARRQGEGNSAEWEGLFYQALALAKLGRAADAEKTALELARRTSAIPGPKEKRRGHHLAGELSLSRGDVEHSLEELKRAEALLPPRGFQGGETPQHVPIWFSLATAELARGDQAEAARYFQRIVDSRNERVSWPIDYVRSYYHLGLLHEARGEREQARSCYERFLRFWGDGVIDRERVAEVRAKL
jgi:tetratricopeptide (TPR) repeat protein